MAAPEKIEKFRCRHCGKKQWGVFLPGFSGKPARCGNCGDEIEKKGLVATVTRNQAAYLRKPVEGVLPACKLLNQMILTFFILGMVCAVIAGLSLGAVMPETKEEARETTITAVHMGPFIFGMIASGLHVGMIVLYAVLLALLIPSFLTREPSKDRWRNVVFTVANAIAIVVMQAFVMWSGGGR